MTRRHFGIRVPKPRPTYTCPARAGAWRGDAFIWAIVVILIVLGRPRFYRGGIWPCGNAPFPMPAHRTRPAEFGHPAFRIYYFGSITIPAWWRRSTSTLPRPVAGVSTPPRAEPPGSCGTPSIPPAARQQQTIGRARASCRCPWFRCDRRMASARRQGYSPSLAA